MFSVFRLGFGGVSVHLPATGGSARPVLISKKPLGDLCVRPAWQDKFWQQLLQHRQVLGHRWPHAVINSMLLH